MIELKNVTKIYQTKMGVETCALDNINVKIQDKGLVFITGKSGSGKSTLLNILGGLDTVTKGNILVNNVDITNISNKQYDAYRNSTIGFVFQEFNLLDEYNVYENIAIAKELQNRKVNLKEISDLLDELDIRGLEKRKINELSGGQKQRVAIARALIKNPKILMCDEPTGNLDSKSSKQIFEILKEISKNILVIVVSHDLKAALKYGDRVIEIEDGKIIKDNKVCINNSGEVLEFKKAKLPFKYIRKIACNNIKARPLKLLMTLIISSFALLFMGISINIILFDPARFVIDVMKKNNYYVYEIDKVNVSSNGTYGEAISAEDIQNIKEITQNDKVNYVYSLHENMQPLSFNFYRDSKQVGANSYFNYNMASYTFIEVNDNRLLGDVIGRIPSNNQELVVHKYFAEYMMHYGIYDTNNQIYKPNSIEELVSSERKLQLGSQEVYIVGVINDDDSLYQNSRERGFFVDEDLQAKFYETYCSKANTIYVKGFINDYKVDNNKETIVEDLVIAFNHNTKINLLKDNITAITPEGVKEISTLNKDEMLIPLNTLKEMDSEYIKAFTEYANNHKNLSYEDIESNFISTYLKDNEVKIMIWYSLLTGGIENFEQKVVGISLDEEAYISYEMTSEYRGSEKDYSSIIFYEDDEEQLKNILDKMAIYGDEIADGIHYMFRTSYDTLIDNVLEIYDMSKNILYIITLVFVLFTILVITNFISLTITISKKKIGILRSLGASSKDMVAIFSYESVIVGLISWFISLILMYLANYAINAYINEKSIYYFSLILNHPLSPVIMLLHSVLVSLIVTVAAISYVNKIKPIDAILDK